MRRFLSGLVLISITSLQPQLAVAKDKYFYDAHTKEAVIDDKNYAETEGFLKLRTLAEKHKGAIITKEYCSQYASVGVKQTHRNKAHKCGYLVDASNNSRWSLDFTAQFHWGITVSAHATDKESRFREKQLKACITK